MSIFSLVGKYAGSIISKQFALLIHDLPQIAQSVREKAIEVMNNQDLAAVFTGKIEEQLTASAYGITGMLIAVPVFAVLKVLTGGAIRIYKIWRTRSDLCEN